VASGEGSGNLNDDGRDEHGPGDPDHHGQGVDQGLIGDALLVEGVAHLSGRGQVVWERPANEVPERPRDPGGEGSEEN
jgi:hypothetical protein